MQAIGGKSNGRNKGVILNIQYVSVCVGFFLSFSHLELR